MQSSKPPVQASGKLAVNSLWDADDRLVAMAYLAIACLIITQQSEQSEKSIEGAVTRALREALQALRSAFKSAGSRDCTTRHLTLAPNNSDRGTKLWIPK